MSSTVIPREKLSAYQRWELNSFDTAAPEPQEPPKADAARPDPRSQREGYEAGYRAGISAAQADVSRATSAQAAQIQGLIAGLGREISALDEQLAAQMLDLALSMAKRIAGEALRAKPELLVAVVRECLQQLGQARAPTRLTLNPADARFVREHLADQCTSGGLAVIEDESVARGGCRLESAGGELDATLNTRWQRLLAAFGRTGDWLE